MANALNLVLKIKQDQATQERLSSIARTFSVLLQPEMEKVFSQSGVIHFARVIVIDCKYLVVIAEYDGPRQEYTEFFRRALSDVFATFFSIAEGAPDDVMLSANAFWEFTKSANVPSLGNSKEGHTGPDGETTGYLFSAYGNRSVKDILDKLD